MGPAKTNQKKPRQKPSADFQSMVYGKIPPQAKDLEEAILGAIMLEKGAIDKVTDILKPESFYMDSHQKIFRTMMNLSSNNQPVDIMTVVESLRASGEIESCGGPFYVTKLTNCVVSSANIETHARIVFQKHLQREMIRISGEIVGAAYDDMCDPLELLDEWEKQITEISVDRIQKRINSYDFHLVERIRRIEDLRRIGNHITGVPSGFPNIDRITHGWQKTDLIILAARPSVGKTALALNMARNATMRGKKVAAAFFSLEMSTGQLVDRNLAAESEIWLDRIANGMLDDAGMQQLFEMGLKPQSQMKLFIDDTPALNIFELRSKARRLKRKNNIEIIFIDYLQLMSGDTNDSRNREREISQISRGLKALAKELEVPIVALSQLSREPEKRKGELKTPQLSDLRESGAIEQDADVVMFMYRPEYYEDNTNEMGESREGETHILISKNRNGKLAKGKDVLKLRADLTIQKFYEWDSLQDVKAELGPGKWRPVKEEPTNGDLPFD